ncbi:MAG: MFS transporter [Bdellovibrionota bacterium]
MQKRALTITFLCAALPVMMAVLLSPGLPALQKEFMGEPEIQVLSKLVIMTPALAIAATAGLLGFLIDRWGRFPILLISLLLFGLFGVQGYWAEDIYALIVTRFFFGIGVAGIMTTTSTTLAEHFDGLPLRRMLGFQAGFMGLWGIVFQVIGGFLAETSWRSPFLLYAIAFPLVFIVILDRTMHQGKLPAPVQQSPDRRTSRNILRIFLLVLLSTTIMTLFALLPVQGPLFFHDLNFSPKRTAFLLSILTASSCVASLTLALWRQRISSIFALLIGLSGLAFSFAWLGHADRWRDLVLSMVGIGAGVGLCIPCVSALIGTLSPSGQKGKILGVLLTANYVGQFFAPIWSQPVVQRAGNHELFKLSAGLAGVLAVIILGITIFAVERRSGES